MSSMLHVKKSCLLVEGGGEGSGIWMPVGRGKKGGPWNAKGAI